MLYQTSHCLDKLITEEWFTNPEHHYSVIEFRVFFAQSAEAVEYTDCTSAEVWDLPPNECPRYDTKQSDGEFPVMLGLWGMRSTHSLPSLPGPLWLGLVAPDMSNRTKLRTYAKLNYLK